MKKIRINLLAKVVIAIFLGIAAGFVLPEWAGRIFATFNALFSQFLNFMIPLIILGLIVAAIADIGKEAGKVLVVTLFLAYLSTCLAGLLSMGVSMSMFPNMLTTAEPVNASSKLQSLAPYFVLEMPPLFDVTSSLVLSFVMGIGIAFLPCEVMKKGAQELRSIIEMTIRSTIIPLLPLFIFGIILNMTVAGQIGPILSTFIKIIIVIFVMQAVWLVLLFSAASVVNRGNPFKRLWAMMPAYMTALATQSSAATIPVTLRQTIKMGVSEDIASFTVPLNSTVHISGSMLKIVACSIAVIIMAGADIAAGAFIGFILMLAVTMVAAPGVPGGAIMASLGLLSSMLGFNEGQIGIMIALYIAMDSFGTACNVTGDGAIALIIDKLFRKKPAAEAA
ncbi:MAG: dicarboxylate/amino acid:cation symporter [Muribaculaceae bacterium]|nr:dicarboxylate/amino acid:cation symporter [Muribaculaceae bacterium]